jgi:hypothetical protein
MDKVETKQNTLTLEASFGEDSCVRTVVSTKFTLKPAQIGYLAGNARRTINSTIGRLMLMAKERGDGIEFAEGLALGETQVPRQDEWQSGSKTIESPSAEPPPTAPAPDVTPQA